jgi:hypothetical protein
MLSGIGDWLRCVTGCLVPTTFRRRRPPAAGGGTPASGPQSTQSQAVPLHTIQQATPPAGSSQPPRPRGLEDMPSTTQAGESLSAAGTSNEEIRPFQNIADNPAIELSNLEDILDSLNKYFINDLEEYKDTNEYGEYIADKANGCISLAQSMKIFISAQSHKVGDIMRIFALPLLGQYVGMAAVKKLTDGSAYIEHIVGHPGFDNAGDILIEKILNREDLFNEKTNPIIKLEAADIETERRYLDLGFSKPTNGDFLILNLNKKNRIWSQIDGNWKRIQTIRHTADSSSSTQYVPIPDKYLRG